MFNFKLFELLFSYIVNIIFTDNYIKKRKKTFFVGLIVDS